jgi:hypothetical protein
MISFTVCSVLSGVDVLSSGRKLREIGDAIHEPVQSAQQCKPIASQRGVLGIDHDRIEKRIDRLAQQGERAECAGVIERTKPRLDRRRRGGNRLEKRALCIFREQVFAYLGQRIARICAMASSRGRMRSS